MQKVKKTRWLPWIDELLLPIGLGAVLMVNIVEAVVGLPV